MNAKDTKFVIGEIDKLGELMLDIIKEKTAKNQVIEKGTCPRCKGLKKVNSYRTYETTCPLCEGEGLIIVKTTEKINQ